MPVLSMIKHRFMCQLSLLTNGQHTALGCVFDTGAMYTCIPEAQLQNVKAILYKGVSYHIAGSVSTEIYEMFEASSEKVKVGDIDIGPQTIYVIKDTRVTNAVLGMDLLSQLDFTHSALYNKINIRRPSDRIFIANTADINSNNVEEHIARYLLHLRKFSVDNCIKIRKALPVEIDMSPQLLYTCIDSMNL